MLYQQIGLVVTQWKGYQSGSNALFLKAVTATSQILDWGFVAKELAVFDDESNSGGDLEVLQLIKILNLNVTSSESPEEGERG